MDKQKPRALDAWLMGLAQLFRALWVVVAIAALLPLSQLASRRLGPRDLMILIVGEAILLVLCAGGVWGSTVFIRATRRQVRGEPTP